MNNSKSINQTYFISDSGWTMKSHLLLLKVSQFRNVFLTSLILPKNLQKNQLYYYSTSCRFVFIRFLGELKTPKRHFEINWPLLSQAPNLNTEKNMLASFVMTNLLSKRKSWCRYTKSGTMAKVGSVNFAVKRTR